MPDKSKKTVKSNTRNNDWTFCGEFLEYALRANPLRWLVYNGAMAYIGFSILL